MTKFFDCRNASHFLFDDSPVLLLTYARISNSIEILDFILKSTDSSIYVFQDAPRTRKILLAQDSLVAHIKSLPMEYKSRIRMKRNYTNQGIAVSMISALDWFFQNNAFGIILEDDLVFNLDFLIWCTYAKSRFENRPGLFLISGNRYCEVDELPASPTLTHYPQTWGWATWRDRWQLFRDNISDLNVSASDFLSRSSSFWLGGTLRVLAGKTDTWDILVARYMYKKGFLSVLPAANLVSNIGDDSNAVHTSRSDFPIRFPIYSLNLEVGMNDNFFNDSLMTKKADTFLEQNVFQIKKRHIFSLYKNILLIFKQKHLIKRIHSNKTYDIRII